MNTNLTETEDQKKLTDVQIFTEVWTSPRKVFKFINDNRYSKYVTVLLFFAGISRAFDRAVLKDFGDTMSLWAIVGLCIILGGLFGWISYYIYAALVSWTGKWLDAKGDTNSILRVLAYALTPSIFALIFLIPQIMIYGNDVFKSDGDITSAGLFGNIMFYSSLIFELILGIFTIVFTVVGVSEVQKLSIGKAIFNILLPLLVIAIPILIIVLAIQLV